MDTAELDNSLREVMEKGFDDSFAAFCARIFSSYRYSPDSLVAARMHAFYLRLFIEERVSGQTSIENLPENLKEVFREVGRRSVQDTLSSSNPTGMDCCRAFVKNWCRSLSGDRSPEED